MKAPSRALALVGFVALAGCRGAGSSAENAPSTRESPQASAEPAPLAAPTPLPSAIPVGAALEGGPQPTPLRGDEALAPDVLPREGAGYTLGAVLRLADVAGAPRAPEVNSNGLEAARKATELRLGIDLSPSRLRVVLLGHGFLAPQDTEVRARTDRYGFVVVGPGGESYRPLAPGSMRALLGERRFDVAPIAPADVTVSGEGARRLGFRTRRVEVSTRAGRASFDLGKLEGAGEGGILLCRLLLDLMNAPPSTAACASDEAPMRAELRWTGGGMLAFELGSVTRRTDLSPAALLVPPATASFAAALFPAVGAAPMLSSAELAALRFGDVDMQNTSNSLSVSNPSVQLRVLFIDGVPATWVAPGGRGELRGLHRGRYTGQWRTFLGDVVEPPFTLTVPGFVQYGVTADAGR